MSVNISAFITFGSRLDEIRKIRSIAQSLETEGLRAGMLEVSMICQGALVLLVGHIEAYFKDLGELSVNKIRSEELPLKNLPNNFLFNLFKNEINRMFINYIQDYHKNLTANLIEFSTTILMKTNEIESSLFNHKKFTSEFSTPSFEKIIKYFKRFGYNDFEKEFDMKHAAGAVLLKNDYNEIIDLRNALAHGDYDRSITPMKLEKFEEVILYFCNSIDILFSDWCERNLCPIR